jgi:predicted RNA binding protein YcfA (HicA-like mRNA interferase family)
VKAVSGGDFAKALERKGWKLGRTRGSHHIYVKEGDSVRISVPIHGNRPLKVGLLKHLMKAAGLEEDDL